MGKKMAAVLFILGILAGVPAGAAEDGSAAAPYVIRTAAELTAHLGGDDTRGKYYTLTDDLDLGGEPWVPLGGQEGFRGNFQGNGHTITGLNVSLTLGMGEGAGLFSAIGPEGEVYDLQVAGSVAVSGDRGSVGGIAGTCAGTVAGCSFDGSVSVSGYGFHVGGLVGTLKGTAVNCAYRGAVSGWVENWLGGLAGSVDSTGTLANSYALCTVKQTKSDYNNSGGYLGGVAGGVNGAVRGCYQAGIAGMRGDAEYSYAGGIAGATAGSPVLERCFWQAGYLADPVGYGSGGDCASFAHGSEILEALNGWAADNAGWSWTVDGDGMPVTLRPAPPSEVPGPAIVVQPVGGEMCYGDDLTLAVAAEGESLVYLWYEGLPGQGTPIPGAEGAEYPLPRLKPGTYTYCCAVADGAGKTVWTDSAIVTVKARPLTVKAEDAWVWLGDGLPDFSVSYQGLAAGESSAHLGGVLRYVCAAVAGSPPGSYEVRPEGLSSDCYEIAYQPGTLTVSAPLDAPGHSYALPGPDGDGGWYVAPFSVTAAEGWTLAEEPGGPFVSGSLLFSGDGVGQEKIIYLKDNDNKKYKIVISFSLDTRPPELVWSPDTPDEGAGWQSSASVAVLAEDGGSGVAGLLLRACGEGETLTGERLLLEESGAYTVTAEAVDRAGNRAVLTARTVRVESALGELRSRVAALEPLSAFEAVAAVRGWYDGLTQLRRDRVISTEEGVSALSRLAELEEGHGRVRHFLTLASDVERPLDQERRREAEKLLAALATLGELRALVPAPVLEACGALADLLAAVEGAEAATDLLPGHLPGADCALSGDAAAHRTQAERVHRAWEDLTAEGQGIAAPTARQTAAAQYAALLAHLNVSNAVGGVTVYGMTDRLDTTELATRYPGADIRPALSVTASLPAVDLSGAEETLRQDDPSLSRLWSYDITLRADAVKDGQVLGGETVQPKAGEYVTIRLALPKEVDPRRVRLLHVHGDAVEEITAEGHGLRAERDGEGTVLLFRAVHLSHFVLYAPGAAAERPVGGWTVYHTVRGETTAGGTVSPASVRVEAEGSARFTVLPREGHRLVSLLLDGVPVAVDHEGAVTLRNVARDGVLSARFVPEWADLKGHWAELEVNDVTDRGLMPGVAERVFLPDRPLTRGEAADFFRRLAEDTTPGSPEDWARDRGLLLGDGGGLRPEDNITRQELAALFYRYGRLAGVARADGASPNFSDGGDVASWAAEAVDFCVGTGVARGRPDGRFDPGAVVTRAEAAAMLRRFSGLAGL